MASESKRGEKNGRQGQRHLGRSEFRSEVGPLYGTQARGAPTRPSASTVTAVEASSTGMRRRLRMPRSSNRGTRPGCRSLHRSLSSPGTLRTLRLFCRIMAAWLGLARRPRSRWHWVQASCSAEESRSFGKPRHCSRRLDGAARHQRPRTTCFQPTCFFVTGHRVVFHPLDADETEAPPSVVSHTDL